MDLIKTVCFSVGEMTLLFTCATLPGRQPGAPVLRKWQQSSEVTSLKWALLSAPAQLSYCAFCHQQYILNWSSMQSLFLGQRAGGSSLCPLSELPWFPALPAFRGGATALHLSFHTPCVRGTCPVLGTTEIPDFHLPPQQELITSCHQPAISLHRKPFPKGNEVGSVQLFVMISGLCLVLFLSAEKPLLIDKLSPGWHIRILAEISKNCRPPSC